MTADAPDTSSLYTLTLNVRWSDMDALGHINNATYFTYCEQARVEWLSSLDNGAGLRAGASVGPVVVNCMLNYHRAVVAPATLDIRMQGGPPGRSSFETFYEVRDHADPDIIYASGSAKVVWVDHEMGKSVPLPDAVRSLLPTP